MKNRLHLKNILKKIARKPKPLRDPQLMHPQREWMIGLIVATFIFSVVASVSIYIYFKNQAVDVQVANDDAANVVYRESLVKEALAIINKRSETLQNLNKNITPAKPVEVPQASSTPVEVLPVTTDLISQ